MYEALRRIETVLPLKEGEGEIKKYFGQTFHIYRFSERRCRIIIDQCSYVAKLLEEYLEIRGKTILRREQSPAFDEEYTAHDHLEGGESSFKPYGGRFAGKLIFLGRCSRPEVSFAVQRLSSKLKSWGQLADKKLEQLMCYLSETKEYVLFFEIYADGIAFLQVSGCFDSDHAGDRTGKKSTTGYLTALTNSSRACASVGWGLESRA